MIDSHYQSCASRPLRESADAAILFDLTATMASRLRIHTAFGAQLQQVDLLFRGVKGVIADQ